MTPPDLTPSPFTRRIRVNRVVRAWSVAVGLCALVAVVPVALEQTRAPDPSAARARERLMLAQNRLEKSKVELKSLNRLLKVHERELLAERHLTERPDWSAVLKLVTRQFDKRFVMTGFSLADSDDSQVASMLTQSGLDDSGQSVWLMIDGVAESNSDVADLIMRVEGLGLFQRVVMTGTKRELFAGEQRTGFSLACRVH